MENNKPLAMAPAQVALNNLSELVKSNLVAVAAAVAVIVVLAGLYFTTDVLQSPQALLDRDIDVEVEKAKRMLFSYEPGGQRLMSVVDAATSQPEAEFVSTDQWPPNMKPLQDRLDAADADMQSLRNEFSRLTGEAGVTTSVNNYAQLKEQLEANLKQVEDALQVVRAAVNMSRESGEETLTGRSHPVATRLQAVLVYHQADLLRRKAAIQRDEAVIARQRFDNLRGQWQLIQAQIAAIEIVSKGGVVGAASQPAPVAAAPKQAAAEPPKEAPQKASPKRASGALRRMVTGLVTGKKQAAPVAVQPSPAVEPTDSAEPAVAEQPDQPSDTPSPALAEKLPTPKQRLDAMNVEQTRAKAAIAAADLDVARLRKQKTTLEEALAAARKAARDASLRMEKLESEGVDPVQPGAMDNFTAEYRKASDDYRKAIREAAVLENGGIRNAKPGTQDEQELLKAPLVQIDSSQPMNPSEGLVSINLQLAAAEAQLKASTGWLASIEAQVKAVNRDQQEQTTQLAALRASQVSLKDEATKAIQAAAAATVQADEFALKAVGMLNGEGKQAAQNARTAANKHIGDARDKQVPGTENLRLETITKAGFLVGHAQTLEGDLDLIAAYIQAERAVDLRRQSLVLAQAAAMGIPADQQGQPAYAYQPAAAEEEAGEAGKDAIAAAKEALEVYGKADAQLKSLWVLRANMAAVYHLLATIQTGKDADDSRQLAVQTYQQALQDRKDRKDAGQYLTALEGLTKAGQ